MKIPLQPKPFAQLVQEIPSKRLGEIVMATSQSKTSYEYHPWDKLRQLKPPVSLTPEEWWLGIKLARLATRRDLPLKDRFGEPFWYSLPDQAIQMLHKIDQNAAGKIAFSEQVTNQATRDRYIVSSLIEEAITSSQLEGASTSRRVAKEMIRSGRSPRDRSEQMILNNYKAMRHVGELRGQDLTPDLVLDIHRIVTEATLERPEAAGRLQAPGEIRVKIWDQDQLLHTPPAAEKLPGRLKAMCEFANATSDRPFMHPVVRAIVLHFWLAYDHPFEDGNGRTARALFYWSMLREGYWLAEFITISRILKQAPAQYARSFLHTELDENDLTYFLLYQLKVVLRSIDELHVYLARKIDELKAAEHLIRRTAGLNHRQLTLMSHAMRNPEAEYTIQSHAMSHAVVYETARSDLLALAERGLLEKTKVGKAFVFSPSRNLTRRVRDTRA